MTGFQVDQTSLVADTDDADGVLDYGAEERDTTLRGAHGWRRMTTNEDRRTNYLGRHQLGQVAQSGLPTHLWPDDSLELFRRYFSQDVCISIYLI